MVIYLFFSYVRKVKLLLYIEIIASVK